MAGASPTDDLRTAGDIAILSKTGRHHYRARPASPETWAPVSSVRPALTGFALDLDASGPVQHFKPAPMAKSSHADYAVPTPARLNTAVLDMEAAYTDFAGRTSPRLAPELARRQPQRQDSPSWALQVDEHRRHRHCVFDAHFRGHRQRRLDHADHGNFHRCECVQNGPQGRAPRPTTSSG